MQGCQREKQRLILFAATMSEMHLVPLVVCSNILVCKWLMVVIVNAFQYMKKMKRYCYYTTKLLHQHIYTS